MNVRRAGPDDAARIEELYRTLVPDDPHITVAPQRIEEIGSHATNHLFVVEEGALVLGTAFLTICLDPMYGFNPYGVIENCIVDAAFRGRGAGRALMSAVESEARAARCTKLMLLSSSNRREAHDFFSHLGFDAQRKRGFVKYLNRTPPLPQSG